MAKNSEQNVTLTEVNPYTELSVLQQRFVEARLQGLTKAAAARAAGATNGTVLEQNPKVRRAIKYLIKESTQNVEELTKSHVMTGMMDAVQAAATATELVQAWREIGKLIGAYEPERKILEVHDYSKEELKTLSDEDLLRMSGGRFADAIDAEFTEVNGGRAAEEPADLGEDTEAS